VAGGAAAARNARGASVNAWQALPFWPACCMPPPPPPLCVCEPDGARRHTRMRMRLCMCMAAAGRARVQALPQRGHVCGRARRAGGGRRCEQRHGA
jgi:hypothetical protein